MNGWSENCETRRFCVNENSTSKPKGSKLLALRNYPTVPPTGLNLSATISNLFQHSYKPPSLMSSSSPSCCNFCMYVRLICQCSYGKILKSNINIITMRDQVTIAILVMNVLYPKQKGYLMDNFLN